MRSAYVLLIFLSLLSLAFFSPFLKLGVVLLLSIHNIICDNYYIIIIVIFLSHFPSLAFTFAIK